MKEISYGGGTIIAAIHQDMVRPEPKQWQFTRLQAWDEVMRYKGPFSISNEYSNFIMEKFKMVNSVRRPSML